MPVFYDPSQMILLKDITLNNKRVDILIEGSLIKKISPSGEIMAETLPKDTDVVGCSGKVAIPGFINMHTHAAMALMRGIKEDVLFHDWLDFIWEKEALIDAEFVYLGTKVACLEMIRTGTTTFNDQYWFSPSAHLAAKELGVRPVISYVLLDKDDPIEAERQKELCTRMWEESLSWNDGSIFSVSVHSVYAVSEETILWASEFARSHNLKLHIHLSETEKENIDCLAKHGLTPTAYLERLGVLGDNLLAAHSLWLTDEDIEILGKHHVNCIHNINSNLKLASGYKFRYDELKNAGVNVCIGTDGAASSNNMDILEALKTSALVQKAWTKDPTALPIPELLNMATVNGAKALGINSGKIEEGYLADINIVNTDSSFFLSPGSFEANLIYSAHSDCIESMIAGGKFVMKNHIIPGEKEILQRARAILREIQ